MNAAGRTIRARALMLLLLILALPAISGCGTMMSFGRMPDTARLEQDLKIGVSTRADLLAALGTPRNAGGVMLPDQGGPRDLWCYYYEEGPMGDTRRMFLFVYLDGDRYDGYMWFSSLPQARR